MVPSCGKWKRRFLFPSEGWSLISCAAMIGKAEARTGSLLLYGDARWQASLRTDCCWTAHWSGLWLSIKGAFYGTTSSVKLCIDGGTSVSEREHATEREHKCKVCLGLMLCFWVEHNGTQLAIGVKVIYYQVNQNIDTVTHICFDHGASFCVGASCCCGGSVEHFVHVHPCGLPSVSWSPCAQQEFVRTAICLLVPPPPGCLLLSEWPRGALRTPPTPNRHQLIDQLTAP